MKTLKKALSMLMVFALVFTMVPMAAYADEVTFWNDSADTTWYNDADSEFTISTAEQLAGLAKLVNDGESFEGKVVNLGGDIDLSGRNFTPIGGVDKGCAFQGTFNGNNNTIKGLTQNGWELGYEYGQSAGMGLFGWVGNSVIKNLKIDGAEISMEAVVMGIIAGYAAGDCTFEGIQITNSQIANYNWDTGGIVGQVYSTVEGSVFKNINIDDTNTISGHWGTWDVSAGGVVGRTADNTKVYLEDVYVACVLDVYNDVVAAYQWYAYRYSGMLVGYTKTTAVDENGRTTATADHVICKNVTVVYGDWANYSYCQFTNVYPQFVREQGGYSTDPYYSGRHWTAAVDVAGNKVIDKNHEHAENEVCGEVIPFDQLFGGGQGVYGTATHDGVTVKYGHFYVQGVCVDCGMVDHNYVAPELPEIKADGITVEEGIEDVLGETSRKIVEDILDGKEVGTVDEKVVNALTNDEYEGKTIDVVTEVTAEVVENDKVSEADIKLVAKEANGLTVEKYFDLSINMTVLVDGKEISGKVTELTEKVTFTIAIPENLKTVKDGVTREFYVIRVHDGEADTLPVTVNADGTLSFETDQFSTYALAYKDTVKATETPKTEVPKTGDAGMMPWLVAMAVAVVGVASLRRKEN